MIKILNPFYRKTALVLGGGGARGIAHFGVIDYLVRNNIVFDAIVGTSAGALFGSLYAVSQDVNKALMKYKGVIEDIELPDFNDLKHNHRDETGIKNTVRSMYQSIKKGAWVIRGVIRQSLVDRGLFEEILDVFFADINLEDLNVKTFIIATDMKTGKDIIYSRGRLSRIVQGSSSIPGILPPVEYGDRILIDGGTTAKLPVIQAIMLGYQRIIAVDVGSAFREADKFSNAIDVFSRIEKISSHRFHTENLSYADIAIRPQVEDIDWYDFKKADIICSRGFLKANEMGKQIKRFNKTLLIRKKKIDKQRFSHFSEID